MKKLFYKSILLFIIYQASSGIAFASVWQNGLLNNSGGVKGVKADFNILNRHKDVNDNSVLAVSGRGGAYNTFTAFGWEISDANGSFKLYLHLIWPEDANHNRVEKTYGPYNKSVGTSWQNLKVERNDSTGKWVAYLQYGNPVVTFDWPYYSTNTLEKTTVEVETYDGTLDSTHAGYGYNVALRAANNTWYTQYSYWDVTPIREPSGSNPFKTIINTPDYNWEATQQN